MSVRGIRIGTRGSRLALAQAGLVAEAFAAAGRPSEPVVIQTDGDRRAKDTAWGEGAFVAAIERALLEGLVDVAVHSAKDIPTDEDRRLLIGAYLPRADPRDALVIRPGLDARSLEELPPEARVGTDSPRRTAFLLARRPDLHPHPLHGNVDTRLRRLDEGETDALLVAAAGLDRLGRGDRIAKRLDPEVVPPAPGQGAIAVQVRRDDRLMVRLAALIDDVPTRRCVEAEREFLAASGGGCRAPIGALAEVDGDELVLLGGSARPDGSGAVTERIRGHESDGAQLAAELAVSLGERLPDAIGRRDIPSTDASTTPAGRPPRVLVLRSTAQAGELVAALREFDLEPVVVPAIAIELEPPGGDVDAAARNLDTYDWAVVTSANGARAIVEAARRGTASVQGPRWAAIGPATRRTLEAAGIEVSHQGATPSGSVLGSDLPVDPADRVLVVRGDLADGTLVTGLRARGAIVDDLVGYRTREGPEASRPLLRRAMAEGPVDVMLFTSGSTVRGLLGMARAEGLDMASIPAVCVGPTTAAEAERAGFRVVAVAPTPQATALAEATARSLRTAGPASGAALGGR